jgi:hypothetical protein
MMSRHFVGARGSKYRNLAIGAAVIVIAALVTGVAFFALTPMRTTTSTTSSSSTAVNDSSSTTTTLSTSSVSAPAEPPLWHEDCATSNLTGTTACTVSSSTAGTIQIFNMTTWVPGNLTDTFTLHTHYFAIAVNSSTTLQFSFSGINGAPAAMEVYFDDAAAPNIQSLVTDLSDGIGSALLINQSESPTSFSGSINASRAGLYAFEFSNHLEYGGKEQFVLLDEGASQHGITIKLGTPSTEFQYFAKSGVPGSGGQSFPKLETWHVTVYSNTTTNIDLGGLSLLNGFWLKFLPSNLTDVGPQGVNTTMLLAGAATISGQNPYNVSLFVMASGSDGLTGEIPITIAGEVPVAVVQSPGPFSADLGAMNVNTSAFWPYGMVYDPAGAGSAASLTVSVSVAGIVESNGTIATVPDWLNVAIPVSSYTLNATNPSYFEVGITAAAGAPLGKCTIALNETVGGKEFTGYLYIDFLPQMSVLLKE